MKRLASLLLLAGLSLPRVVSAICMQLTPADVADLQSQGYIAEQVLSVNILFPQGSVSIDPDLPIGSPITTGQSAPFASAANFANCLGGGEVQHSYLSATSSQVLGYYNTNVPGVGYRLSYVRSTGTSSEFPWSPEFPAGNPPDQIVYGRYGEGALFQIDLVKTGDIASNTLVAFGTLGTGQAQDGKTVTTISGGSLNVRVMPSCSVDASTLNIDFGSFGPADVSTTVGPTQHVSFNVLCTGPTPPASITATLAGTPDTVEPTLLRNNGAQHLAIRLTEPSTRTVLRPNDPASTLVHAPNGGMQSPFDLEATVLRVGTATPTAGMIQATATITLTLQ
ncbi:fimbrial protein [Burkholderia sp. JSH-S8]|nr:fimbrial protein [Burkholderia sp. JSH-S8]